MNINKTLMACAVLLVLCSAIYSNSLHNGFLMDDELFILPEDNVASLSNMEIIREGAKGIYRPLNWIVLKYEILLSKKSPVGYQLVNIFIFLILGINFYLIIKNLTGNHLLALVASCLYAAHPINNFLVNYKTASGLQLHIFFMQASTLFFLRYFDKKQILLYILSLGSYFLGFFCHEIIFMLPVYLFLILHFFKPVKLKEKVISCGLFVIPFGVYMIIRSNVAERIKMSNLLDLGMSVNQYIATMQNLIGWYLGKLMWPKNVIFTWDARVALDELFVLHLLILISAVGLFIWLIKTGKGKVYAFSICLFLAGFLPSFLASFTYTPSMKTVAIEPHWFGFTSIGFFILIAYLLLRLGEKIGSRTAGGFIIVLIGGLSILTFNGNAVWKNANTFCRYWLNVNSTNGAAWNCLAKEFIKDNDKGVSLRQYSSCRDIAYLGWAYHTIGHAQTAYDYYSLALKKDDQCAVSLYGLGLLYYQLNEKGASQKSLAAARKINPAYYPAYLRLVDVFSFNAEKDDARKIAETINAIENTEGDIQ